VQVVMSPKHVSRKMIIFLAIISLVLYTLAPISMAESAAATYQYTGSVQKWVVPAGVSKIKIEAWGAQGGTIPNNSNTGGLGGYVSGEQVVSAGQILYVYVGGQGGASRGSWIDGCDCYNNNGGWNGGGSGSGSRGPGGGGGTDVRIDGTSIADRAIVAGGGAGGFNYYGNNSYGGNTTNLWQLFQGENGDTNRHSGWYPNDEAGGGGGYYGGRIIHGDDPSSGYGGSSYYGSMTNGTFNHGVRNGHGMVKITIVELNTTPPEAPLVNEVKDNDTQLTGTAEAGSTITVTAGDSVIGTATTNEDGTFTVTIPLQPDGTILSVTASNSYGQVSEATWITVLESDVTPPVTEASLPQLPDSGWYGADVTVTLTATDDASGVLSTEYQVNGGEWQVYSEAFVLSSEQVNLVQYRSVDNAGNLEEAKSVQISIDKTAPSLSVELNITALLKPNHKLIPIVVTTTSGDATSGVASVTLTSITSNEPDNGEGDGDKSGDIQNAEIGTYDTEFLLRAERSGKADGRAYTITYTVIDNAGNETSVTKTVNVPHDRRK